MSVPARVKEKRGRGADPCAAGDGPKPGRRGDPSADVARDCMRVVIRRALVQRITERTYAPGDRLLELKIAKEFGTSQGPVREALRELEGLRLVEIERYRGTRVREVSHAEMAEAASVRGVLEVDAVHLAAPIGPETIAALRAETAALIEAARQLRLDDYARHNEEFHRILVVASGNETLLRVWESLLLEARTRMMIEHAGPDLIAVAETHHPIVDALERGDLGHAGALLQVHADVFALEMSDPRVREYITHPDAASQAPPAPG